MMLWVQVMTETALYVVLCVLLCLSERVMCSMCMSLQITKEELLADVARDILLYISRDLTDEVHAECV